MSSGGVFKTCLRRFSFVFAPVHLSARPLFCASLPSLLLCVAILRGTCIFFGCCELGMFSMRMGSPQRVYIPNLIQSIQSTQPGCGRGAALHIFSSAPPLFCTQRPCPMFPPLPYRPRMANISVSPLHSADQLDQLGRAPLGCMNAGGSDEYSF